MSILFTNYLVECAEWVRWVIRLHSITNKSFILIAYYVLLGTIQSAATGVPTNQSNASNKPANQTSANTSSFSDALKRAVAEREDKSANNVSISILQQFYL